MRKVIVVFLAAVCPGLIVPGESFAQTVELPKDFILVAHRGVTGGGITENSLQALEATIARKYTHIEADLRCTKDGQAVVLHDRNLERTTGVDKMIDQVTLDELHDFVSEETVPSFETFCSQAAGRIDIMPDLKGCPPVLREDYVGSIEASLIKHDLMDNALFIGSNAIAGKFYGKGRIAWRKSLMDTKDAEALPENPGDFYFVFNHGEDFDQAAVDGFHALGFPVIVSINTFHYTEGDPVARGKAHVREMIEYGVDGLQIDSVYDQILDTDTLE